MTIDECYKAISEINKDNIVILTEDEIRYRANWLYFLNRLNFWEELPYLIELIQQEIQRDKIRQEKNNCNKL